MKKIAILSITGLFILAAAFAQPQSPDNETAPKEIKKEIKAKRIGHPKLEGKDVSYESKEAFDIDFPKATDVEWERSQIFDEASFNNKDGLKLKAYYDADGKLVGTTQYVTFASIPSKGQEEIKKQYSDYNIGKVVYFKDNEANETDMVLWESPFDGANNYFVELTSGTNNIIVKVDPYGAISFFKQL